MSDRFIESIFRESPNEESGDLLLGPPRRPITRDDVTPGATEGWAAFRKVVPIKAVRVSGPFTVQTSEGLLSCQDGWLAIDARGYPYPIADDEFQQIYERLAEGKVQGPGGPVDVGMRPMTAPAPTSKLDDVSTESRLAALRSLRLLLDDDIDTETRLSAAQTIMIHTTPPVVLGPFRVPV